MVSLSTGVTRIRDPIGGKLVGTIAGWDANSLYLHALTQVVRFYVH